MRCSTCGERLNAGEERCPVCGAVVEIARRTPPQERRPVAATSSQAARPWRGDGNAVRECPRCGYRSQGIAYFQKGSHLALLIGISVFTYGIGGLVYYARCRRRKVCVSCGFPWEHQRLAPAGTAELPPARATAPARSAALATAAPEASHPPARQPASVPAPGSDHPLPSKGIGRRVAGAGLGVLATMITTAGIAGGFDGPPILVGGIMGMAGSGMFLWGWKALQHRRQTVLQNLNRKVLLLAGRSGGVLTVTEVAAELDLSLAAAEKVLNGMEDGLRVRSDVSDEGVIYYEFPELVHQGKLRAAGPA